MTEDEFSAYQSLSEETEDHRWAFGTGFTDPLEGIDASVPDGVDAQALAAYCLMLGDDALIYSHRLQQWMTRMPELEEETALANIALDLFGKLAASADPVLAAIAAKGAKELAYHRDYAAQWVIRLGDGTPVSHGRMQAALVTLWPLV